MVALWVYHTLPRWFPFSVPGLALKMPRSGALQDGRLILRLASACVLQGVRVALARRHSGWLSRPAPVLGCLTSRGPLGPACGFYRARVRCLDVALINFKSELGAAVHERNDLPPCSPCFVQVFSNMASRLRACRTLRDIVSLGLRTYAGLRMRSRVLGSGGMRGQEDELILGVTACSLSTLGQAKFCSPSSSTDTSK